MADKSPKDKKIIAETLKSLSALSMGLREVLDKTTTLIETSFQKLGKTVDDVDGHFKEKFSKISSDLIGSFSGVVGSNAPIVEEISSLVTQNNEGHLQVVQAVNNIGLAINEQGKNTTSNKIGALLKPGAPVNKIASQRAAYEDPTTKILKNIFTFFQDRFPKKGLFAAMLNTLKEDKDVKIDTKSGGGLLGFLGSILGFLNPAKLLGLAGLAGSVATIGLLLGAFAAIGGFVLAITKDSKWSGALKVVGRLTLSTFTVISELVHFLSRLFSNMTKAGGAMKFGKAFAAATKGIGVEFPRLVKFLTFMGEAIDGIITFIKPIAKDAPKIVKTTGTFAKFLPKLGVALTKGGLRFIPFIGTIISFGLAAYRFSRGDWIGGSIDLVSGFLSLMGDILAAGGSAAGFATFGMSAGVGWGLYAVLNTMALGLDVLNFYLDYKAGGMTRTPDGGSVTGKKAETLFNGAKKAIGGAALSALGMIFGPIFNVIDGLKLIGQGNLMEGLDKMGSFDFRFNEVLSFLGLEPVDLGLEEADVPLTQSGLGAGIGGLIELVKVGLLLTGFTPIIMFGRGLHTLAKGGSSKDALIDMAHVLPFAKYILNLIDLKSGAPDMKDVEATDYSTKLTDLIIEAAEKMFVDPVMDKIEWLAKSVESGVRTHRKWADWSSDLIADILVSVDTAVTDLRHWIGVTLRNWWTDTGKAWYDNFKNYFTGEMTEGEKRKFELELMVLSNKVYTDIKNWLNDQYDDITRWFDETFNFIEPWNKFWDDFNKHVNDALMSVLGRIIIRLEKIGDDLYKTIVGESPGFFNDLVDAVKTEFTRAGVTIQKGITIRIRDIVTSIDDTMGGIKDDILSMIKTPKDKVHKLRSDVNQSVQDAALGISNTIDNFMKKAVKGFDNVVQCIESAFPEIVEFACKISKHVRDFFDNTLGRVKTAFNVVTSDAPTVDKLNAIYSKLPKPEWHEKAVEKTSDLLYGAGDVMSRGAKSVMEAAKGLFKRSPWLWEIIDSAGMIMAAGGKLLTKSSKEFLTSTQKISEKDVSNVSRDVTEAFDGLIGSISSVVVPHMDILLGTFKGTLKGLVYGIVEKLGAVNSLAQAMTIDMHEGVKDYLSKWSLTDHIIIFFDDITTSISQKLSKTYTDIEEWLSRLPGKLYGLIVGNSPGFLKDVLDNIADALNSTKLNLVKFVQDIPSKLADMFTGFIGFALDKVKSVFTGAQKQIEGKIINLVGAASSTGAGKAALGHISTALNDISRIGSALEFDIANLKDSISPNFQRSIKEMEKIILDKQQVKVEHLKPIDININEDQFTKMIMSQEKTYDVLNVQISKILTNINDSIQNIQINTGGGLVPAIQGGNVGGEAINAAYNDRQMQRQS